MKRVAVVVEEEEDEDEDEEEEVSDGGLVVELTARRCQTGHRQRPGADHL